MMINQSRLARAPRAAYAAYAPQVFDEKRPPEGEAPSLAMVYPVFQRFEDLYEPGDALYAGTLFKALEKPFHKGFRL